MTIRFAEVPHKQLYSASWKSDAKINISQPTFRKWDEVKLLMCSIRELGVKFKLSLRRLEAQKLYCINLDKAWCRGNSARNKGDFIPHVLVHEKLQNL